MRNYVFVFFLFITLFSQAQVVNLSPLPVHNAETIVISYDANDSAAKLKGDGAVRVRVIVFYQDGHFKRNSLVMEGNKLFKASFFIPDSAAFLRLQFYTNSFDDERQEKYVMVYKSKSSKPQEGARLGQFFSSKSTQFFLEEINDYPENYFAFASYFNVQSMLKDEGTNKAEIMKYFPKLDSVYKKSPLNPGLLSALCISKAKTGELNAAKNYLRKLIDNFPLAYSAQYAFGVYRYEHYKVTKNAGIDEDVLRLIKGKCIQFPSSPLLRDNNVIYHLRKDTTFPLEVYEQALLPMYLEGQVEYYDLGLLPRIYLSYGRKLHNAKDLIESAIHEFESGTIYRQYRLNEKHYKLYVPEFMLTLAEINSALGNFDDAIMNCNAALNIISGSTSENNYKQELIFIRANAYKRLGNLNMAIADYATCYDEQHPAILDSLKSVYSMLSRSSDGFGDFLSHWISKTDIPSKNGNTVKAPDFSIKNFNGQELRMANLKGKIVVMNFWGTGCGPCVVEMPELNNLVKKYNSDVTVNFIAFTADDKSRLKKFFLKRKFDYQIVPDAKKVFEKYSVGSMPVHIIIDQQGNIAYQSIGTSNNIVDLLSAQIKRLL